MIMNRLLLLSTIGLIERERRQLGDCNLVLFWSRSFAEWEEWWGFHYQNSFFFRIFNGYVYEQRTTL